MVSAPMITLIGVFGLDAESDEYRTENLSSSIEGKTSSKNTFAQLLSSAFSHVL